MMQVNRSGLVLLVVRLSVAATFVMAALPKLQDPTTFSEAILGYQLIGRNAALWIAITLPWLELVGGIGLITQQVRRASAIILGGLLLVFIALHLSAWSRGLDISCGCFDLHSEATTDYTWPILRNLALLAFTVCIAIRDFKRHRDFGSSPIRF